MAMLVIEGHSLHSRSRRESTPERCSIARRVSSIEAISPIDPGHFQSPFLRGSTAHAGYPVAASTATCGGRLDGAPAHGYTLHRPRPCPESTGDLPPGDIPRPTSLLAPHCVPRGCARLAS